MNSHLLRRLEFLLMYPDLEEKECDQGGIIQVATCNCQL